jgi:cyclopropane fatty-acyl-phospholipid synthase-like methyltransferase
MDSYEHLAKIYDQFMIDVDYKDWAEYLAGFFKFDDETVIDVGCGTGNITIEFNKRGYDIIGIDASIPMLDIAQEKARKAGQSISFVCQEASEIESHKKVDVVVASCDVVNYIEKEQLAPFFERVYDVLKADGTFLFDISSSYKLKNTIANNIFFEDDEQSAYIWNNELYDNYVAMDLILFVKCDEMYERYTESHIQYIYEYDMLADLLNSCGFECKIYDFLSKDDVKHDSQRIQFVCKKR